MEHLVGTPPSAEFPHLGGAVGQRSSLHGAIDAWEAPFNTFALGMAPTSELGTVVLGFVSRFRRLANSEGSAADAGAGRQPGSHPLRNSIGTSSAFPA